MSAIRLFLLCLLILLTTGHLPQTAQAQAVVDLTGEWKMTLPVGFKYIASISRLDARRWQLSNMAGVSGLYELRGNELIMVPPPDAVSIVWQIQSVDNLVLIKAPAEERTGTDYTGATLQRLVTKPAPPAVQTTSAHSNARYPSHTSGRRIYDFASLLSSDQTSRLETLTSSVAAATTAELNVVTVSSLHGETVDEYANTLFNQWRIGRADTNNGVLFLIAPNERRMRIEVGYGLEPLLTDGICGEILAAQVRPLFKASRYSEGVIQGSEAIANLLRQHPEEAKGIKDSAPNFLKKLRRSTYLHFIPLCFGLALLAIWILTQRAKKYPTLLAITLISGTLCGILFFGSDLIKSAEKEWIIAGLSLAVVTGIGNVFKYLRFRPRHCPGCKSRMVMLKKHEKEGTLTAGQQKEEELYSVEYDVWLCRSCNHAEKIPRKRLSTYKECQKCERIAVQEKKTVLTPATTASTGLARVDSLCLACGNEFTGKRVIPRESSSSDSSSSSSSSDSSSSSSSSDGGSSGGGGASGDW